MALFPHKTEEAFYPHKRLSQNPSIRPSFQEAETHKLFLDISVEAALVSNSCLKCIFMPLNAVFDKGLIEARAGI